MIVGPKARRAQKSLPLGGFEWQDGAGRDDSAGTRLLGTVEEGKLLSPHTPPFSRYFSRRPQFDFNITGTLFGILEVGQAAGVQSALLAAFLKHLGWDWHPFEN